jgi:hypothetical protein
MSSTASVGTDVKSQSLIVTESLVLRPTMVKINISGRIFETHKENLDKMEYFAAAFRFSGNASMDYSNVVIDRDDTIFAYLLNCIRDSRYCQPAKLKEYQPDIEFFQITSLLKLLSDHDSAASVTITPSTPITKEGPEAKSAFDAKENCIWLMPPFTERNNPRFPKHTFQPERFYVETDGHCMIQMRVTLIIPTGHIGRIYLEQFYLKSGLSLVVDSYGPGTYNDFHVSVILKDHFNQATIFNDLLFAKLYIVKLQ